MLCIKEADDANDLAAVLSVVQAAFGEGDAADAGSVTELVREALKDPSAKPFVSLLALKEEQPAGYILFTKAHLDAHPNVKVSLLAPLAVAPKFQKQGIGGQLIEKGVDLLTQSDVQLVFVTGSPQYYSRHAFRPASTVGFEPPYPMPDKYPDAWMVRELCPEAIVTNSPAQFMSAKSIDRREYWEE